MKKKQKKMTSGLLLLALAGFTFAYSGTACKDVSAAVLSEVGNPTNQDDITKWDCIYFGIYPQGEITGSALTEEIKTAQTNEEGYLTVQEKQYKKVQDVWSGEYRYYLCEPIKWRVLSAADNEVFLLADRTLDYQTCYICDTFSPGKITSVISSWLNESFINQAFTSMEKADMISIDSWNTSNMVSLLTEEELLTKAFGFSDDKQAIDPAKTSIQTDYANRTMLNARDKDGNTWALQNFGKCCDDNITGYWWPNADDNLGYYYKKDGVRPVIRIDLSDSTSWSYAGTVSSDGTVEESEKETVFIPTLQDAQSALKAALGITASNTRVFTDTSHWDMDGDGTITLSDAKEILKQALNIK